MPSRLGKLHGKYKLKSETFILQTLKMYQKAKATLKAKTKEYFILQQKFSDLQDESKKRQEVIIPLSICKEKMQERLIT